MFAAFLLVGGIAAGFALGWVGRDAWREYKGDVARSQYIVNGHEVARFEGFGWKCRSCGQEQGSLDAFEEANECSEWAMVR